MYNVGKNTDKLSESGKIFDEEYFALIALIVSKQLASLLRFKSAKYCVTEKFQMIEKSEESSIGNKANYIVINGQQIGVKYGSIPYWGLPTMAISSTQVSLFLSRFCSRNKS